MHFQSRLVFTTYCELMKADKKSRQKGALRLNGGLVLWMIFGGVFLYAYLKKYGLVAGWLHAAAVVPVVFIGSLLYKAAPVLASYFQQRYPVLYWHSPLFKLARGIYPLTFFVMLYFWLQTRPDVLLLSKILEIPIEAFYPCSGLFSSDLVEINSDLEAIAGELWKAPKIGYRYDFNCGSD